MSPSIPEARDAAQQIVTLLMHGDRHEAIDLAMEHEDHLVLAITLADLAAYIHYRWGRALDMDGPTRLGAWQSMLADVAEWRLTKEAS